jgi:hypothetical protein
MLDGVCDGHSGGPGGCLSSMARLGLVGGGLNAGELAEVQLTTAGPRLLAGHANADANAAMQRAFPQV